MDPSGKLAEIIYYDGNIVTLNDDQPSAEAVAVKNGEILAVGSKDDIFKLKAEGTRLVDLAGKTLLPGFVDAHGHVYGVGGQATFANLLPAPDGEGTDIAAVQRILRAYSVEHGDIVKRMGW